MSDPHRVRMTGPLSPYLDGFRRALEGQGYRSNAVANQLQLAAHVSRWLAESGLTEGDLTNDNAMTFLLARRTAGYALWLSEKGLVPLLSYLRQVGVAPIPEKPQPRTATERIVADFATYLSLERGLAPATIAADVQVAKLFLSARPENAPDLQALLPSDIVTFVKSQCEMRGAAYITAGLRAFLRFCYVSGSMSRSLVDAVPAVAHRRLAGIPKALDQADVQALVQSCDRTTAYGQRDFAVLMLLSRLGLRSGEVASLCLEDIDWCAGEITITGKGKRTERLPLLSDVGEALVSWLKQGRPKCEMREVFTCIRAPRKPLSPGGIYGIVIAAASRAGLEGVNPHRLRHTVATEMLAGGAGLGEIGQVLRHERMLTTSIYAKVDRKGLRELASPWPTSTTGAVTK